MNILTSTSCRCHARKPLIAVCSLLFVGASFVSANENVLLPANGGVLDSFTGEYDAVFSAARLTNEILEEDGWSSPKIPKNLINPSYEFVYSFNGGNSAVLTNAVIHGGTGEGQYYSKDVEVLTSTDGVTYISAGSGTLTDSDGDSLTLNLTGITVKYVKFVITSGHDKDYWELGEFVVNGTVVYPLTVNSGTGSGNYAFGTIVDIVAGAAPVDKVFDVWIVNSGSLVIADINNDSSTLTMAASAASITPSYISSVPNSNQPPVWLINPTVKVNAQDSVLYSGSFITNVVDIEGDTLTFNKVAGPAWLSVASNGDLIGTPSLSDVGLSIFTVNVSDGINTSVGASIEIAVDLPNGYIALGNVISPTNGGVMKSFTGEYDAAYGASNLTNGIEAEAGWSSAVDPGLPQEFVYSFSGGNNARLTNAVIHGGTGEGKYYSKDIEVLTSTDGVTYISAENGTLAAIDGDSLTFDLTGIVAQNIKLKIISGYRTDYWELGEFAVNGMIVYPLTVNNGTGDENYELGAVVSIEAETILGQTFDSWVVISGSPLIADSNASSTTLAMPAGGVVVEASYNFAPSWTTNPTITMNAQDSVTYSSTLSGSATDPESDSLTFAKINGPVWLSVDSNGDLSGTPGSADLGLNSFTVSLSDLVNSEVLTTLDITVTQTPFSAWATVNAVSGRAADPDSDGLTNEFEYLKGLDPNNSKNPRLPALSFIDGIPAFTYTYRTDAAIVYTVQISSDIIGWHAHPLTAGIPVPNGDGTSTITVIPNTIEPHMFFRLQSVE